MNYFLKNKSLFVYPVVLCVSSHSTGFQIRSISTGLDFGLYESTNHSEVPNLVTYEKRHCVWLVLNKKMSPHITLLRVGRFWPPWLPLILDNRHLFGHYPLLTLHLLVWIVIFPMLWFMNKYLQNERHQPLQYFVYNDSPMLACQQAKLR